MRTNWIALTAAGFLVSLAQAASIINISFVSDRTQPSSDATLLLCMASPVAGAVCAFFLARTLDRSGLRWAIACLLVPFLPIFILSFLAAGREWKEWRSNQWRYAKQGTSQAQATPLAARLLSMNLGERQAAIQEVYARTAQGNRSGLDAVEEALLKLAKRPSLDLYRTTGRPDGPGRLPAELAPDSLISLAEAGKLLENPSLTQMFIHQTAQTGQADRVVKRITEIGGEALRAYQLLATDLLAYADLRSKGVQGLPK